MVAQRQLTEEERRQLLAHTLASAPANTRTQLLKHPGALEHFSSAVNTIIVVVIVFAVVVILLLLLAGGLWAFQKFKDKTDAALLPSASKTTRK